MLSGEWNSSAMQMISVVFIQQSFKSIIIYFKKKYKNNIDFIYIPTSFFYFLLAKQKYNMSDA